MKVYYGSSLWYKGNKANDVSKAGIRQEVNWQFNYLGRDYIIPYIYHFSRGIVIDIIGFIDDEKLQAFYDQYKDIDEDNLSDMEYKAIEAERPYGEVEIQEIWLNGKKVMHGFGATMGCLLPFGDEDEMMLLIREAYKEKLQGKQYFNCQRVCVDYPNTRGHKRLKQFKKGNPLKSLKLVTRKQYKLHPINESFTLTQLSPVYETSFSHPITGNLHKVELKWEESIEMPFRHMPGRKLFAEGASYRIIPPLDQEERLEFDASMQYTEERQEPEAGFLPQATGSVAIIGGACGPTAIFCAAPIVKESDIDGELEEQKEHATKGYCFSKLGMNEGEQLFYLNGLRMLVNDSSTYEFKYL